MSKASIWWDGGSIAMHCLRRMQRVFQRTEEMSQTRPMPTLPYYLPAKNHVGIQSASNMNASLVWRVDDPCKDLSTNICDSAWTAKVLRCSGLLSNLMWLVQDPVGCVKVMLEMWKQNTVMSLMLVVLDQWWCHLPDAQVHSFSRMQSSSTVFRSGQPKFGHHVRIDGLWVKLHGVWEVSWVGCWVIELGRSIRLLWFRLVKLGGVDQVDQVKLLDLVLLGQVKVVDVGRGRWGWWRPDPQMPPSCSFKARPRQLSGATPFGDDPSLQLLRHTDLHSLRGRRLEISPKGDIGGRETEEEKKG